MVNMHDDVGLAWRFNMNQYLCMEFMQTHNQQLLDINLLLDDKNVKFRTWFIYSLFFPNLRESFLSI